MIESLFKQRSTLDRLQSGPLAQYLPSIADALHQEQYPPETIRRYVRVADGLGRWLGKHGLSLAETDETILARYRARTGRRKRGQLRAAGRGLPKVLALLRMQCGGGDLARVADTEGDTLVAAFDSHLQDVAGLMPGTRSHYLRHAVLFLNAVFGTAPFDVTKVTPQAITDFVRGQAAKLKPSSCAAPATSMRVFLRFLIAYHGLPAGVVGAVPTIRQWKLASLPKHLSVEEGTGPWQLVTSSRRLANGIALSCCYSFGSRCGPGKLAVFVCQMSTGEQGRFESILRNPRGNESCPCRVMSAKPLQGTCRIAGPRAPSLSSFCALVHRSARLLAPAQ